MTAVSLDDPPVGRQVFFVTCGRGMEPFVVKELSTSTTAAIGAHSRCSIFNIESVHDGKVFFESDNARLQKQLFNLKSAERIFVCVAYHNNLMRLSTTTGSLISSPSGHLTFIRRTCTNIASSRQWRDSFFVWSRLQAAVSADKYYLRNVDKNEKSDDNRIRPPSPSTSGTSTITAHIKARMKCASTKRPWTSTSTLSVYVEEQFESRTDVEERAMHAAIPAIAFRISCKCSGLVSHQCPPQNVQAQLPNFVVLRVVIPEKTERKKLSRWIATSVERHLPSWTPDLRNPLLEVYVHLNDDLFVIGFPLSRQPLSRRSYLNTIALRTTVCWAMACAARIKPGDHILDPMCGAGTLIVEAAVCWPVDVVVGVDVDLEQLVASEKNIERSGVGNVVYLAQGMVQRLPFRNNSFDVVLCDYPFGLKYGTMDEAKRLLPKAVLEINRVCKHGGRIVFLLSLELHEMLVATVSTIGRVEKPPVNSASTPSTSVSPTSSSSNDAVRGFGSKMIPRSVMSARSCNSVGLSAAHKNTASNWKRLSSDRLKLGNLETCIVAHVKRPHVHNSF